MYTILPSKRHTFIVFATPTVANLRTYIQKIKGHDTPPTVWVRACAPIYDDSELLDAGLTIYDLQFTDGSTPPDSILDQWSKILKRHDNECIAIHCVAGLGRAPLLAGLGMINDGIPVIDVITKIRHAIPAALNIPQLRFLESYKPRTNKTKSQCLLL
jgi:protein tyrosine phosphatase type IVA